MRGGIDASPAAGLSASTAGEGVLVVLAGGGTGGHIYPNVAVWQRLEALMPRAEPLLVVSRREVDARVCEGVGLPWLAVPAEPLRRSVGGVVRFVRGQLASARAVRDEVRLRRPERVVVVATGGFVSPAAVRGVRSGAWLGGTRRFASLIGGVGGPRVEVGVVCLDASPGRAMGWLMRGADGVFRVGSSDASSPSAAQQSASGVQWIGMPVRREALGSGGVGACRRAVGLAGDRPVLLVTAGSQGARSVNELLAAWVGRSGVAEALRAGGWQVLHLCGQGGDGGAGAAYEAAGVDAVVAPYWERMGQAWGSAALAVSRAGAGSVAEAWANGVPTVFLPYPYHKDEHQRLNAAPMVATGGAAVMADRVDAAADAAVLEERLGALLADAGERGRWREALERTRPADGAGVVARWVAGV